MLESAAVEHEYRDNILDHMLAMEKATMCDSSMIDTQPEIEWEMRPYLLDFLTRSHLSLRLNHETLFLAINIIDRYSSQRIVFVRHYQLLGSTALWIASKYQDKKTRVPTLEELKILCSNAYDSTMFTQMELHILNTLEWSIGHPTVDLFVDMCFQNPALYISDKDERSKLRHMILFLAENANYHQDMLSYPPSIIASAAFKLSVKMLSLDKSEIPAYDKNESACIDALFRHSSSPTAFLERKYSIPEFSRAYQSINHYHVYIKQQHQKLELQQQQQKQLQQLLQQQYEHNLRHHYQQQQQQQQYHSIKVPNHTIRNFPPLYINTKKIPTPTPYTCQQLTTPVKSPMYNSLEPKASSNNPHVGYMTPPFTPEETEIPILHKHQQKNPQNRPSSRAVSAQQQLKQEQEQQHGHFAEYEDEDEEYQDSSEHEDWEALEEDMAYEYNYHDDSFDLEEERARLSKDNGEASAAVDHIERGEQEKENNDKNPACRTASLCVDDEMSDNESIESINSMESGSKDTMSSLTSMPSISSLNTSMPTKPMSKTPSEEPETCAAEFKTMWPKYAPTCKKPKPLPQLPSQQKPPHHGFFQLSRHRSMIFSNPTSTDSVTPVYNTCKRKCALSKSSSLHFRPFANTLSIRQQIPHSLSHNNFF